jgi:NitT/TauT family transport system permease protein
MSGSSSSPAPSRSPWRLTGERWDPLWFALAVLAIWQGLAARVGAEGLSSPEVTLARLAAMMATPEFWMHAAATGRAVLWSILYTVLGGLTIGLVLGLWRLAGEVAEPILNTLYAIPKITLYPVILLFFGLGIPAKVAFGVAHGIFPVILLTVSGVRATKPVILRTARSLRLSPAQTILYVLVPAALPEIFTGLRIGIVLAMFGTLIGELFAAERGLGFLLMQGVERGDVPTIMALALLLFAIAVVTGLALLALDRRLRHAA